MEWDKAKQFLMSWGVYPARLNPETRHGEMIMGTQCYKKMISEAASFGDARLTTLIGYIVDTTDGEYYITHPTWDDIQDIWDQYWFYS